MRQDVRRGFNKFFLHFLCAGLVAATPITGQSRMVPDATFNQEVAKSFDKTVAVFKASKTANGKLNVGKLVSKIQNRMNPAHLEFLQKNLVKDGETTVPYPEIAIDGRKAKFSIAQHSAEMHFQNDDKKFFSIGEHTFSKEEFQGTKWLEKINPPSSKTSLRFLAPMDFYSSFIFGSDAQAGFFDLGDLKDLFKPINVLAIGAIVFGTYYFTSTSMSSPSTTPCCDGTQ